MSDEIVSRSYYSTLLAYPEADGDVKRTSIVLSILAVAGLHLTSIDRGVLYVPVLISDLNSNLNDGILSTTF